MKSSIAVVILTLNEEVNVGRCLESVKNLADEIFVVDSHSTDRTREIAESFGSKIYEHDFKNQADQFNWALDNIPIKSDWIFRLDADEVITSELQKEIMDVLRETPEEVTGFYIKRRVYFMGRWIKHGGYYPIWFLRLFKRGVGRSENREMDEHIILFKGRAERLKNDFIDDNKKNLAFWIAKHNDYASREANELVKGNYGEGGGRHFYYKIPKFLRALIYFKYRYFLRLGFLDGIEGLIFHVLHGFWYRFLIDSKLYERKK